jgi:hypothetical protein
MPGRGTGTCSPAPVPRHQGRGLGRCEQKTLPDGRSTLEAKLATAPKTPSRAGQQHNRREQLTERQQSAAGWHTVERDTRRQTRRGKMRVEFPIRGNRHL